MIHAFIYNGDIVEIELDEQMRPGVLTLYDYISKHVLYLSPGTLHVVSLENEIERGMESLRKQREN